MHPHAKRIFQFQKAVQNALPLLTGMKFYMLFIYYKHRFNVDNNAFESNKKNASKITSRSISENNRLKNKITQMQPVPIMFVSRCYY